MQKHYIYKGNWPDGIHGIENVKMAPGIECPEDKIEWIQRVSEEYRQVQHYLLGIVNEKS